MAQSMISKPGGTITSVLSDPSEIKAAYRLLDCDVLTHEAVCQTHFEHVRRDCTAPGLYLLIEDTTALSFPGRDASVGLGPIGMNFTQGLWMHSTLAVRAQHDGAGNLDTRLLGLFAQHTWVRPTGETRKDECKMDRQRRTRESQRWARAVANHPAPADDAVQWVYVADRESDIYEAFDRCGRGRSHFVIRAGQDRALADADMYLFAAANLGSWLVSKRFTLRRAGKPTREVKLQIRASRVTLRGPNRPDGRLKPRDVNLVLVEEIDPPQGEDPLRWVLLTDLPIDTAAQVLLVVSIYCERWLIEEFHKALKTGMGVEKSQLSTARRLMALSGILSICATALLDLKLQARGRDATEPYEIEQLDASMRAVLERKHRPPITGWTAATLLSAIAKLGGYLGRRNDGPPGWLTLWRGWQTLLLLTEGYNLAREPTKRCGER